MKIKIFESAGAEKLEEEISKWLRMNKNVTIKDKIQTQSQYYTNGSKVTISIWYEE